MGEQAWPMVLSPEREEEYDEQARFRRVNAKAHAILQERIADLDVRLVSLTNHMDGLERTMRRRDDAGEREGDSLGERVTALEEDVATLMAGVTETAALLRDLRLDMLKMAARKDSTPGLARLLKSARKGRR